MSCSIKATPSNIDNMNADTNDMSLKLLHRRNSVDIRMAILGLTETPTLKTHIAYLTHLDYTTMNKHILFLLKLGCLQKVGNKYVRTDNASESLKAYHHILKLLGVSSLGYIGK